MGSKEKTRTENKEDSNPTKFQQQKAKEDIQILLLETNVFTNIYTYISVYNTHIYNQPEREKLGKDYTNIELNGLWKKLNLLPFFSLFDSSMRLPENSPLLSFHRSPFRDGRC